MRFFLSVVNGVAKKFGISEKYIFAFDSEYTYTIYNDRIEKQLDICGDWPEFVDRMVKEGEWKEITPN